VRRVRFLRLLLPALLVPFVLLIVLTVRHPTTTRPTQGPGEQHTGPRVEALQFDDLIGGTRRMSLSAREGWQDAQGAWQLKGVDRLEIERQDAPPIVIRAEKGGVTGAPGSRVFRLEGGVEIREQEEGVLVSLPTLEVDQEAGIARSLGDVKIEAPNFKGRAASVVYSLKGEPTELRSLEVLTPGGLSIQAVRAFLRQGTREAELFDGVRATSGAQTLLSESARLLRGPDGRLEKAFASGGVVATDTPAGLPASSLRALAAEFRWAEGGSPAETTLEGNAELKQGESSITASTIHVLARSSPAGWEVTARDEVRVVGLLREGPGEIRSDILNASLDGKGVLERGRAEGNVRFDSGESTGEAASGSFEPGPGKGLLTLHSAPGRRARLTSGATRVVGDHIVTRLDGSRLDAEGRVEATLLPQSSSQQRSAPGLFRVGVAVHFVAARLESEAAGRRSTFRGSVRGWQGDRNLSAEEVIMDQEHDTLVARGKVTTRMPRSSERATSDADFVQISADRLDYAGGRRQGVYAGAVRVRQAEGWVECARLEVDLSAENSVREIRGFEEVKLEFRAPAKDGVPKPITGEADRLVYTPGDHTARLYGDKRPAAIRRSGEDGGTTTGRVLRYRLDLGSLEVESGERDRARIRPSP
jgi:lipopolysaccharide transport protein LptA